MGEWDYEGRVIERIAALDARVAELEGALQEIVDTIDRAPSWPALVAANALNIASNALESKVGKAA